MEPYLGQLRIFPYNFAPQGWALCDGKLLSIQENTALFSLLGVNFGGDGVRTFGLPKLDGPGANLHYYIALQGIYPSRG